MADHQEENVSSCEEKSDSEATSKPNQSNTEEIDKELDELLESLYYFKDTSYT